LFNCNHFNQKTYINVINHAQNYNVELDYQYKQHTLTHSIMQPETANGNAIRACDFKIRSKNELWSFLNLPSHRSIRAASKCCRTHPGSTSRGVPHKNHVRTKKSWQSSHLKSAVGTIQLSATD